MARQRLTPAQREELRAKIFEWRELFEKGGGSGSLAAAALASRFRITPQSVLHHVLRVLHEPVRGEALSSCASCGREIAANKKKCLVCKQKLSRMYYHYRSTDKRAGLQNDLTRVDILSLTLRGCSYCGAKDSSLIGLDRIDNTLGHTRANVVPSCWWCNIFRSNMPIAAWRHILPAILEARKLGLFGDWVKIDLSRRGPKKIKFQGDVPLPTSASPA